MQVIFLPEHYRFPAEIIRVRDNGNYDIIANNTPIGNVEARHLEMLEVSNGSQG